MQTPSHFLITAVIKNKRHTYIPISTPALLLGSVLPDIPFAILTIAYGIYYRTFGQPPADVSVMEYLHLNLFFTDPVWLIGHNFFHSLIINTGFIALGIWSFHHRYRWGQSVFWLAISTQLHTMIDIFTHHSDGPLLFFPLNWTYRFPSPISYWETAYYGRTFATFEYLLDFLIIGYFIRIWFKKRKRDIT